MIFYSGDKNKNGGEVKDLRKFHIYLYLRWESFSIESWFNWLVLRTTFGLGTAANVAVFMAQNAAAYTA